MYFFYLATKLKLPTMKNFLCFYIICLFFSIASFCSAFAESPENIISINFGNTISSDEDLGSVLISHKWNTLYKGNSAYLLNSKNEQSTCYLKTNATGSISNGFNPSDFSISSSYLSTHEETIRLTLYDIPYDSYRIYVYFNQFHDSETIPVVINGLSHELPKVMSDDYSGYCIIDENLSKKIDLTFYNEVNIAAIQIAPENENENINVIPENRHNNSVFFPTYVEESINIDTKGFSTGQYIVEIFDNTGKIVKNSILTKTSTSNIFHIQLGDLYSGVYTISILGNQSRICEQILIK
jgi:hypothetical protein